MRVQPLPAWLLVLHLVSGLPSAAAAGDPAAAATPPRHAAGAAGAPVGDEFLRGYIVSVLEQVFHEGRERVRVEVASGAVTLSGSVGSPEEIDRIVGAVGTIQGAEGVVNRLEIQDTGGSGRWRTWT